MWPIQAGLRFLGQAACAVKTQRIQRRSFIALERELTKAEYRRFRQVAPVPDFSQLPYTSLSGSGVRFYLLVILELMVDKFGR